MNKKRLQGRFIERVMAHRYRLDEYSREELVKIYMALNEAEKSILRRWDVSTDWSRTRARRLLKEARAIMGAVKPRVGESLADLLGEVSASSSRAYSDMLSLGGRAGAVRVALLSAEQMRSFWRETPVGGRLLQDWVNRVFDGPTVDAVQRQVFAGMFEGEGFREMAKRLQEGFVVTRREAETLVHTYVQTANVHAMEEVYKKNRDVVVGVRWLTAFDQRTCIKCAALSGKLYPLDEHPDCPCHPRCRCVLVPETDIGKLKVQPKIAEDWAKDLSKKPPGLDTVLTPDGIPKTDFRRWIMAQPEKDQLAFFGPNRYGLLKDGKIGWDDLVEEDGKTVRVRLLPELLGDRVVAHRAGRNNGNAAKALGQIRKERADLDLDRHKAMAAGLDERAMQKAVGDAARAAKLFADGEMDKAKALGGKALEKIVRGSGLLGEKYGFEGIGFGVSHESRCMETSLRQGKIWFSEKTFQVDMINELGEVEKVDWQPFQGVLNAIRKIHEGAPLSFVDEASLQGLHHEIQHTRQLCNKGRRKITKDMDLILETVNEWTSRRNYHAFLQRLGRNSIISDEMKKHGIYYPDRVKNFDALLNRLGIKDMNVLDELSRINDTKEVGSFAGEVGKLLKTKTSPEAKSLSHTFDEVFARLETNPENFKKWINQ